MSPDGTEVHRWTYLDSIPLSYPFVSPRSDTLTAYAYSDSGRCLVLYVPGDPRISSILQCGFGWLSFIKISPDHGYVAFNTVQTTSGEAIVNLSLLDRFDGSVRVLVGTLTEGFDFDPGGGRIVYSDLGRTRGLQVIDIRTGEVSQLTAGHP